MMCFDLVIFVAEKSPIIILGAAKKVRRAKWVIWRHGVGERRPEDRWGGWSRNGSKNIPVFLGESQTLLEEHEKQKPRKLFLFIASLIH